MAKFKYVGEPVGKGRQVCQRGEVTYEGVCFPVGEAVSVENEALAARLRKNTHFEEVIAKGAKEKTGE